jgi:hypothetical protein
MLSLDLVIYNEFHQPFSFLFFFFFLDYVIKFNCSYLEAILYEDKGIEAKWGSSMDSIMSSFFCNLFHLSSCHELTLDIYVSLP